MLEPETTEPSVDADLPERSSIGRNIAQLLASQVVTFSMSLVVAVTVPRFLGPSVAGQLRLAGSLWGISTVAIGLGTAMYLTLTISKDRTRGLALLGPILVLRTIAFAVVGVVLAGIVGFSDQSGSFTWIMAIMGAGVLFAIWSEPLGAAFLGLERTGAAALAVVISRTAATIATVAAVLVGGGAIAVVGVGAVASFFGLVLVARSFRRVTTIKLRGWPAYSHQVLRGSVAFLISAVLITAYRELDTVIMAALVDDEVLGWYGTADQLIGSSLFMVTIVMASIFPVLGRLHQADPAAFVDLVRRSYGSLLVMAVPIGLGIVIVAKQLVPLLFGSAFEPTAQVLVVYGLVSPFTFGAILFGTVAYTTGRQGFWNVVMVIGIVATVPLDVVLIPWADRTFSNGAVGGATAYLVTEGFMFVVGIVVMCPFLLDRHTTWRSLRIVLAGGLMFASAWPLRERFLLVPIAVAIVVYGVALVLLRVVTDDERQMVGRLLDRVGISTRWAGPAPDASGPS